MLRKDITSFTREYEFLSNFYDSPVMLDGVEYRSVECAYQAAKTLDLQERRRFVSMKPSVAKRAGRRLKLRSDWEEIKISVMYELVTQKFSTHDHLRRKLLATGSVALVEGNWWGDTFWGVCRGRGENWLGNILMLVRDDLRATK